ncbi:MAG: hypothetical protein CL773_02145 [Chloroflexi bacterium]|nr:hypothetical protein [Chloroflexota bacterium]
METFQKGKEILVELKNFYSRLTTSILGIILIIFSFIYLPQIKINFLIFDDLLVHPLVLLSLLFFILEFFFQLKKNISSRKKTMYIFIILYLVFFLHIIFIENNFLNWEKIFFFVLFQVFTVDISGYLTGKILGKNKIKFLENISPNKTIEGYFGSILIGLLGGYIYLFLFVFDDPINFSTKTILIISVIFTSIIGDLFVSKVKRSIKVKDFSKILYGHGGISDRLDSLLPSFAISFWIFFLL